MYLNYLTQLHCVVAVTTIIYTYQVEKINNGNNYIYDQKYFWFDVFFFL